MSYDVSIVPCSSYEPAQCRRALEEALAPLGGLDWVSSGMRIVIKVNLVSAMKPEAAATTHPALLTELVKMLKEKGAEVILGDSPGGLFNAAHLNHVYDVCGLRACEEAGAQLNQDFSQCVVKDANAVAAKEFQYTAYLDKADAIIDFCKLKTHGMMGMTNAVKNYFGVIPGTMKPEYHFKYPNAADFADMLIDLCQHFKPRLVLCDAVVGMEGNGPTMGTPRKIGALLAGLDAHKVDLVSCGLLGYTPGEIPTLKAAIARGLIPDSAGKLSVFGDPAAFAVPDWQRMQAQSTTSFRFMRKGIVGKAVSAVVGTTLTPYPKPAKSECIGCAKCAGICPAGAITMRHKLPVIDRGKCIHCFCCQEFCPKGAMKAARSGIMRLLNR